MDGRLAVGIGMALLAFAGVHSPVAAAAVPQAPPIFVGGRAVHEPAILEHRHVLVPVRGIFETLHARVYYTPPRIVVVRKNDIVVAGLVIGSRHAVVENRAHMLAVAPLRRGGRVYVPLRVVAEIVGATVTYMSHPRLIDIHVPGAELADAPVPVAAPVVPLDEAPPLWAVAVVGVLVVAFAFECFRRLMTVLAAKRSRVPR